MKVEATRRDGREVELNVEVEPERLADSLEKAYRKIVRQVNIPGFRRGKAPRGVVERMVGHDALWREAVEELMPTVYAEALVEANVEAIADPEFSIVQQEPLIFKAIVPLRPEVTLGDIKAITAEAEEVKVERANVDEVLKDLQERYAEWAPVERVSQMGDRLTIDMEGEADGQQFLSNQQTTYPLMENFDVPVAGFAAHLVGVEPGAEVEFDLTMPEDYSRESVRGKTAHFKVKVSEVKEKRLPELDNELVKKVGAGETVAELEEKVEAELRQRAEESARDRLEDKVIGALVEGAQIEYPKVLVDREISRMLYDMSMGFARQGVTLDQYMQARGKTREDLTEELRPRAEDRVKRSLALGQLAEQENIQVTQEEVHTQIDALASEYGDQAEQAHERLSSPESWQNIELALRTKKVVDSLIESALGQTGSEAAQSEGAEEEAAPQEETQPEASAEQSEAASEQLGLPD